MNRLIETQISQTVSIKVIYFAKMLSVMKKRSAKKSWA